MIVQVGQGEGRLGQVSSGYVRLGQLI